jgi:putative ABC transport system ATP-binding protein
MAHVLELSSVEKTYGRVAALRGVDVAIPRGELVAVVGPSGSGKSTLLNLMGALDVPSKGVVRVDGVDLATLDDDALTRLRRDRLGFVFQFFNLVPTLSALENVMLPALLGGREGESTLKKKAQSVLERVGLGARSSHLPRALSGGEMQRVAIARALLLDPPLVLADEPTGNLDSRTGDDVLELLVGARSGDRTVVLVTHDERVAARADRVLTLKDGRIESDVRRSSAKMRAVAEAT